jgi:hypothetical protein
MDKLTGEKAKLVELVLVMSSDYLIGQGPNDAAYISNLRMIAGKLEQAGNEPPTKPT